MAKKIITISREFGSGGRSIGKKLADDLNIPYYDKELVKKVSVESGFDPNFIEERGEYSPSKSKLATFFSRMGSVGTPGIMNGMSVDQFLWCIQCDVIHQIADEGPCVIVGRCADYILKDREDVLNVFIYANKDYRAKRIVELYGQTEKTPQQRLEDKDERRRAYCKEFTDQNWGQAQNYDICLNTSLLGEEKCIEIIETLYKQ